MSAPEQWLPSASDQEERLPIGEDVTRAYIDGRNEGRADERARIRRGLLEEAERWETARGDGSTAQGWKESALAHCADDLRAALDRICPEG